VIQGKKISVIIPNYNYGHYLTQAVESVLNQSYNNLELIVVNNGSTDNSLEVLMPYKNKIRLIDQSNLGQSGARNSGLAEATGDLIAFLDADDFWEPSKLAKQIALFSESTQLVYCGIAPFKDSDSDLEKMPILLPKYRGDCTRKFVDRPGDSVVLSGESTALFSMKLLNKVGSFDFNFKLNKFAKSGKSCSCVALASSKSII
jgi:glycosyltransferase involved in cell wall biosynthesis